MKPVMRHDLTSIGDQLYEISQSFRPDMRVPARFYADQDILTKALEDRSLEQLVNTATLPGVTGHALAMPDIHWGYGFPIGGVAATLLPHGIVSPGGVGYDINCGVRLIASHLDAEEVVAHGRASRRYRHVPSGSRRSRASSTSTRLSWDHILADEQPVGATRGPCDAPTWSTEHRGRASRANPDKVSLEAKKRGLAGHARSATISPRSTSSAPSMTLRSRTSWACARPDCRADSLRQPRVGPSVARTILRTSSGPAAASARTARTATGLRAARLTGGPGLPRAHELRGQLRLSQPPGAHLPREAFEDVLAGRVTELWRWSTTSRTTWRRSRRTRSAGAGEQVRAS